MPKPTQHTQSNEQASENLACELDCPNYDDAGWFREAVTEIIISNFPQFIDQADMFFANVANIIPDCKQLRSYIYTSNRHHYNIITDEINNELYTALTYMLIHLEKHCATLTDKSTNDPNSLIRELVIPSFICAFKYHFEHGTLGNIYLTRNRDCAYYYLNSKINPETSYKEAERRHLQALDNNLSITTGEYSFIVKKYNSNQPYQPNQAPLPKEVKSQWGEINITNEENNELNKLSLQQLTLHSSDFMPYKDRYLTELASRLSRYNTHAYNYLINIAMTRNSAHGLRKLMLAEVIKDPFGEFAEWLEAQVFTEGLCNRNLHDAIDGLIENQAGLEPLANRDPGAWLIEELYKLPVFKKLLDQLMIERITLSLNTRTNSHLGSNTKMQLRSLCLRLEKGTYSQFSNTEFGVNGSKLQEVMAGGPPPQPAESSHDEQQPNMHPEEVRIDMDSIVALMRPEKLLPV